jgi:carbonic anhydrase/acetyltransferase-like protein (isoleucine patch superfamily)
MAVYSLNGDQPEIDETTYVHPAATVIGKVTIGPRCVVLPGAIVRGDAGEIRIGAECNVQDLVIIHATPDLATVIGDGCTIGHRAFLEGCTLADAVLIGADSVLGWLVRVETEAIVGVETSVTESGLPNWDLEPTVLANGTQVPSRALALGRPTRIVRDAVSDDDAARLRRASGFYAEEARVYATTLVRVDAPERGPEPARS